MLFKNGFIDKTAFFTHLDDNGAEWCDLIKEDGFCTYIFWSVNKLTKIPMCIPDEEIPEITARQWFSQLGVRVPELTKA